MAEPDGAIHSGASPVSSRRLTGWPADAVGVVLGALALWAIFGAFSLVRAVRALPVPLAVGLLIVVALFGRRLLAKVIAEGRVIARGRRNQADLVRHLVLRPTVLGTVALGELATIVNSRVDSRLKALAGVKAASMVGCLF
jgi:hypothetical protein